MTARARSIGIAAALFLAAARSSVAFAASESGARGVPGESAALDVNAISFDTADARIVLGETAAVDVKLTAKTKDGAPLDVAPPRLSVSTGTVSAPVRTAPGSWTTTFTPPKDSFPHVAIVVATIASAQGTAVGFASLHLWGKGQTTVKTKPKSSVTVFIGNESFGPVVADGDGEARVPIIVPPGPERAVARSVDDVGNESQKTIDLGVPTFNRLAALALDDTAPADGVARLLVFAVDKKGEPLYDAKLTATASVGGVDGAPVGLAPGMFSLAFRPGKAPKGKAHVDVALEGAAGSKAGADVEVLTGKPARAVLETSTSSLSADAPREITVLVHLFDGAGNAVPARAAGVDVDYGRIDSISDAGDGGRRVVWVVPPQLRDPGKATVTARTPGGDVLGEKTIALLAGKPAKLTFDPVDAVVADGNTSVDVHVRVVDQVGNQLVPTGAAMSVDPEWGQLVGATVDGKLYRARFVPTANDHAAFAPVSATLGALHAEAQVKLVPRPRARLLVGPAITAGSNYGSLLQGGPDVSLLVRLPGFDGSVHAGLSVSVLQSLSAPSGVDHRSFPVYLEGAWRPLLSQDLALHLGVAAGFVLTDELKGKQRIVLPGAAAQAVAGVAYRAGPGFIEVDVRAGYGLTFPPNDDVGAPLGSNVVLGYRFGI